MRDNYMQLSANFQEVLNNITVAVKHQSWGLPNLQFSNRCNFAIFLDKAEIRKNLFLEFIVDLKTIKKIWVKI